MANGLQSSAEAEKKRELALRWYQARLGFWQAIWGTLITGGLAVAIPASVEAYKVSQERKTKELELALKGKEVELKGKEIEGKRLEADQQYIKGFLSAALDPNVEARIRFSQYFSYVASDQSREGWKEFFKAVEGRRNSVRELINGKQKELDTLRAKRELSVEEQSQLSVLQRELNWYNAELGYNN